MDMAQCADHALGDGDGAGRSLYGDAGRVFQVARFADGRVDAELELLGHGDFHLRLLAHGPEHAHALHASLGADKVYRFFARELARLGQLVLRRERAALAEQRLHVLRRQVHMVRRHLDGHGRALLRLQDVADVAGRHGADGLAGDHALLVGGDHQHPHTGAIGRYVVYRREAVYGAVLCLVDLDAHVAQALACQAAHARAPLSYPAGEYHGVEPLHGGHVRADVLAYLVAERLVREERPVVALLRCGLYLAHVVGDARHAQEPALVVDELFHVVGAHFFGAHQVDQDSRVEVAAARSHQ